VLGEREFTNDQQWALYVQPRADSGRYLVSVPVEVEGGNTLDAELGAQLARGLRAGHDQADSDRIEVLAADGSWQEYYLLTNAQGDAVWWDLTNDVAATLEIPAGEGFWITRTAGGSRARNNAVFVGRTRDTDIAGVAFTTNGAAAGWKWKLFGWPYAQPVAAAGQANPFGFAAVGSGGSSGLPTSPHENLGDQIWVWHHDTGRWDHYWLVDDGDGPGPDGVWWDTLAKTNASFALDAGWACYYRQHVATNGVTTGTNFTWRPVKP
jgi:hypothetical protein